MNSFISKKYRFCIQIDYNQKIKKGASELIRMLDKYKIEVNNQLVAGITGLTMHAIKLEPNRHYDWHFDNGNWDSETKTFKFSSHNRYWTHLIYLTDGAPLEIGELNVQEKAAVETMWSAPAAKKLIARIHHKPGLSIIFPGFMTHRVHPDIRKARWTLSEFITNHTYKGFNLEIYNKAKELYFNEYIRNIGVSP